jgi:Fe-S-cluster-containing hydrogenase component 2
VSLKKLIFDPELCTGCRACELACSFINEGVFSPAKARIRVVKFDRDGIDVPVGCEHCEDAPCMIACPVRAIYRDEDTYAVTLDPELCIGCKRCLIVCPFGAIGFDEERKIFFKCDLCRGEPECVKWCFTQAVRYSDSLGFSNLKKVVAAKKVASAQIRARDLR